MADEQKDLITRDGKRLQPVLDIGDGEHSPMHSTEVVGRDRLPLTKDVGGQQALRVAVVEGGAGGGSTDMTETNALLTDANASLDAVEAGVGAPTDAESAAGAGTGIAIIKRLRTLLDTVITRLGGGLPAALHADGGLKTHVQNLPATQDVAVTNFPASQTVHVDNLPATQPTSSAQLPGALDADGGLKAHVTNFPATQPVSSTQLPAALDADGGMKSHITNFPATQPVSVADGASAALGATTDAEAAGNGSLIAISKRIRTRIDAIITALAALTDGTQKSKITDGVDTVGISTVGGAKALKVDVVQTTGGGGGGGGAVTAADGALATIGTTTDAEAAAGNGTQIALLKRIRTLLGNIPGQSALRMPVALQSTSGLEPGVTNNLSSSILGYISAGQRGLITIAEMALYDGTTDNWYPMRGNGYVGQMFSNTPRTSSPAPVSMDAVGYKGIRLTLNLYLGNNSGDTLTLRVYDFDDAAFAMAPQPMAELVIPAGSGNGAVEQFALTIYPGIDPDVQTDAAHRKHYSMPLSNRLYFTVEHSGGSSWTYNLTLKSLM